MARLMSQQMLSARLSCLTLPQRTAFAIGCAERVLCLYDFTCGPHDQRISAAVNLCWRYVGGEEPELDELETVEKGLGEAIPILNDGGSGMAHMACMTLVFALDSIDDTSPASAVHGAFEALDAVDVYEDYFEPLSQTWSLAEQAWQMRAISVCETIVDGMSREQFIARVGPFKPEWYRDSSGET